MIAIENLSLRFHRGTPDERVALDDLSFVIAESEFLVVIGTNGAGKTTLLNAVAGSIVPERGRIGVFNRSYYEEVLVVRVHRELLAAQRLPPPAERVLEALGLGSLAIYLMNTIVIGLAKGLLMLVIPWSGRWLNRTSTPWRSRPRSTAPARMACLRALGCWRT